ncbi:MAG: hypothetical protein M3033_07535 [Acidobacteriota bacterium]|nr:hypothetical protein [Acidobacteriota bacterium]
MKNGMTRTLTGDLETQQLRRELQRGSSEDLWRRRGIIGLSLVGITAATAITLFQTGV